MRIRMLITAGLVLTLTGVAQAARLATAPMRIDNIVANGNALECSIVNIGKKNVEVTITTVLDNTTTIPLVVSPGGLKSVSNINAAAFSLLGYCIFEVKGGKKNVRASACARDKNQNCRAALPALLRALDRHPVDTKKEVA